jgi:hypothetical protein
MVHFKPRTLRLVPLALYPKPYTFYLFLVALCCRAGINRRHSIWDFGFQIDSIPRKKYTEKRTAEPKNIECRMSKECILSIL